MNPAVTDSILDRWRAAAGFTVKAQGAFRDYKPRNPNAPTVGADDERAQKWIAAMVKGCCDDIAATAKGGRRDAINVKSIRIGTFVHGGYLDERTAFEAVDLAARKAGLPDREGGPLEIEKEFRRGLEYAQQFPAVLQLDDNYTVNPAFAFDPGDLDALLTADPDDDPDDEEPSSWQPVDLTGILDGTYHPPEPGLLHRSDGQGLLYPGHVHWMHGESESGKSWVAQAGVAGVLRSGGHVLYIDHESNPGEVVNRLLAMQVDTDSIRLRFDYVRPDVSAMRAAEAFAALLETNYDLIVIDGVTDAVGLDGVVSKDNDEIAGWMRRVPTALAKNTGGAVVCIDHVSKDTEGRGRFAIGGQHKMAGIDGAAYLVEPVEPLGQGLRGSLVMRIAKDRPGAIRPHCGKYNKVNRLQEAARVVIDSTQEGRTAVSINAPDVPEEGKPWRPTELMERVSRVVEERPGVSHRGVSQDVKGNKESINDAIKFLVQDGFMERDFDDRGWSSHRMVKPYRQVPEGTEFAA